MCFRFSAIGRGFAGPLLLLLVLGLARPSLALAQEKPLLVLETDLAAAISPAQADLLDAALDKAQALHADMLLMRLDTPGGGIETMRRMVAALLNAKLPVVVWVAPSGARAASAGVFLMAAATVAAMAPQTTIGSASPVGPGGENLEKTIDKKIRNDLESLLRGLADAHGRNADWYRRSVASAANLTAAEAARERVVEYIAVNREDLLAQIGKRGLALGGEIRHFEVKDVVFKAYAPGWRYDLLSWLLDPQIAYILLLIGVAGVFFELTTPGVILPGVVGGLCLLLALYALSVLPTNAAGLLLLLFGGGLFLLELHFTSYGLLSVAGIAALFIGSLLLFRFEGHAGLPLRVILPTVGGVSMILILAVWLLAKAQRQKPRSGLDALIGQTAQVRHFSGGFGKVFVHGELWNAVADPSLTEGFTPATGETVVITAANGMTLSIAPRTQP